MNNEISLLASFRFLQNPKKLAEHFQFNSQTEIVNKLADFMGTFSDNEIKTLIPFMVQNLIEQDTKYQSLFNTLKNQIEKEQQEAHRSISPDDLLQYLQIIKENWQVLALIFIGLRSLGANKLNFENSSYKTSIETESIIKDIMEIVSKTTDTDDSK
jgi:hypothetical protein